MMMMMTMVIYQWGEGDYPSTSYNKDFTFKKLRTLEFDTSQCLIINKFRRQKTLHYIRLLNTY